METNFNDRTTRDQRLDGIVTKKQDREMALLALILVLIIYALYVIPLAAELFFNK